MEGRAEVIMGAAGQAEDSNTNIDGLNDSIAGRNRR
jgi:hypothetical protein